MAQLNRLGSLERTVMDHLWDTGGPQTVRQVRNALCVHRDLAYTTVMTVLHRLASKDMVVQIRDDRAYRYAPVHSCDELVARLMVDALAQVSDRSSRQAALMHFVGRVGADETDALRRALAEADDPRPGPVPPQELLRSRLGVVKRRNLSMLSSDSVDTEGTSCPAS